MHERKEKFTKVAMAILCCMPRKEIAEKEGISIEEIDEIIMEIKRESPYMYKQMKVKMDAYNL